MKQKMAKTFKKLDPPMIPLVKQRDDFVIVVTSFIQINTGKLVKFFHKSTEPPPFQNQGDSHAKAVL